MNLIGNGKKKSFIFSCPVLYTDVWQQHTLLFAMVRGLIQSIHPIAILFDDSRFDDVHVSLWQNSV